MLVRPPYLAPPTLDDVTVPTGIRQRAIYDATLLEDPQMARVLARYAELGEEVRIAADLPLKLTVVDGAWSYVGSSNIDPRSLRLNFEVDIEVIDPDFAELIGARIDAALAGSEQVKLEELRARPFVQRLVERITWLGSPYL